MQALIHEEIERSVLETILSIFTPMIEALGDSDEVDRNGRELWHLHVRWMSVSRRMIGPSGRSCGLGILERRADWQLPRFYLDSTIQDFATCSGQF
ncbi:putative beta-D-xylosidase 7 [Iris pallida]|uniref:Beta-D-xylosidase 7 n=1 Tax=Iris pallida TaxID=29817 RepID=A0AAX6FIP8_IRIPA|nr:putative beta-D-xylosidase 7 [Iris pallida]